MIKCKIARLLARRPRSDDNINRRNGEVVNLGLLESKFAGSSNTVIKSDLKCKRVQLFCQVFYHHTLPEKSKGMMTSELEGISRDGPVRKYKERF